MSLNTPIREWRGKRVWVVGASTGIGAALATELSARGAYLALSARNRERLESLARTLPGSLVVPLDISAPQTLLPALMQILDVWGGVDVVVLNAGVYTPVRAWDLVVEGGRAAVEINLMGVINSVAVVVPQLLQQGAGALVVVASVAGYRGLPKALVYGASKAAVINFCESLYLDLAPRGIGVFLVNPGFVNTQLTANNDFHMPALISPEAAAMAILRGIASGRFEIHFPRRFTLWLKLLRLLPAALYLRILARVAR